MWPDIEASGVARQGEFQRVPLDGGQMGYQSTDKWGSNDWNQNSWPGLFPKLVWGPVEAVLMPRTCMLPTLVSHYYTISVWVGLLINNSVSSYQCIHMVFVKYSAQI